MNDVKWVNQFQPQTLVIATLICYIDAVFGLIFGVITTSVIVGIVIIIGLGLGGFGIANEKRWGYVLAVVAAVLQLGALVALFGLDVFRGTIIINLIFDAALVALLLHPMSRDYQRIWFK